MDLLRTVEKRALDALQDLRKRAADEAWDQERVEQEKSLFMLNHEVTLCCAPGCLELVTPVPGFSDLALKCKAHGAEGGGDGA